MGHFKNGYLVSLKNLVLYFALSQILPSTPQNEVGQAPNATSNPSFIILTMTMKGRLALEK